MQQPAYSHSASRPASYNVSSYLRAQAGKQPDALAIAVSDRKGGFVEQSFAALEQASDAMATALQEAGIGRGTRSIVLVPPSPDFFALTFAMFKLGAVPVFLDPAMGSKALTVCMASVKPQAFIGVAKAHWARVALGFKPPSLKQVLRVGSGFGPGDKLSPRAPKAAVPVAQVGKDELAAILFTSGSTGVPKGVEYTHGMFHAQVQAIKEGFNIAPGERELSTFPLFALFGPALGMASIVPDMDTSRPGQSNPDKLLRAVERYGCTSSFMSPALVKLLARGAKTKDPRLASLRRIISAGAPSRAKDLIALAQRLDPQAEIWTPYGMTEAMPLTRIEHREVLALQDKGQGGVCVGRPLPGVQIDIIDIDDRALSGWVSRNAPALTVEDYAQPIGKAKRMHPGEVGEIVVTAQVASHRYWERPIATQHSKLGPAQPGVAHRSGDLGYLDEEGRLWVCGRKSHRVMAYQKRYLTLPCEAVINRVEGVARSALVGLGVSSSQRPVICIELQKGANPGVVANLAKAAAAQDPLTQGIQDFLIHSGFPVDPRHNAKINREALATWARKKIR